jgi:hypothetical protein
MRFFATLVAGAACVATAVAQINIAFTSVPVAVVVGQPYNITWGGGDGVTVREVTLCERLQEADTRIIACYHHFEERRPTRPADRGHSYK